MTASLAPQRDTINTGTPSDFGVITGRQRPSERPHRTTLGCPVQVVTPHNIRSRKCNAEHLLSAVLAKLLARIYRFLESTDQQK